LQTITDSSIKPCPDLISAAWISQQVSHILDSHDELRLRKFDDAIIEPQPTNTMRTSFFNVTVLLVLMLGITLPASALTPRGHPIQGVIQKVNPQTQEVEMCRDDKGTIITFVTVKRTTFIANGNIVDAAILKPGVHVEVSHHVPFFGKPFVTRVALMPAPTK
jgi:hypothetical protein